MKNAQNPIRIYSPTFDVLGEIDDYESLQLVRRWNKQGEFTLYINRHKVGVEVLQKGNVIFFDKHGKKSGIIKHRYVGIDANGRASETLQIIGHTLGGVMSQRVTIPPAGQSQDTIAGSAETVMKHYVRRNVTNPVDPQRKISVIEIASDLKRGPQLSWYSRYKSLSEELNAVSIASSIGWTVYPDLDKEKWLFDVLIGRDLTADNTAGNPPVIFSPEFDNIEEMSLTDSDMNYKNLGYIAGQGEGIDRKIIQMGSTSGLDRLEVFIDARDVENEADLPSRGEQKLLEFGQEFTMDGKVLMDSTFVYEVDWDLGDYVTIRNKDWGVTADNQITVVEELYEENQVDIRVTFGIKKPSLLDNIKRELSQMSGEIRK